jgi:hypothetical protein
LGGSYQLERDLAEEADNRAGANEPQPTPSPGASFWVSDAWFGNEPEGPAQFRSPLMAWFRGTNATMTMDEQQMSMTWVLRVETEAGTPAFSLPDFSAFGAATP